jgi:hypothetical protein
MNNLVTLTLTGSKRFMISGTTHTIEKWQQVRVDSLTAEHLLDQYFTDKSNQEQPYFEEGVVKEPPQRADRKRIRASQRRLDREADRARSAGVNPDDAESMQAFRQDAQQPQDPYGHQRAKKRENPDWAVNTDVVVEDATRKTDNRVFESADERAERTVEVEATPRKRAAPKKKAAGKKKTAAKTRTRKRK